MKCRCNSETRVLDSREKPEGIKRRRECLKCGHRWTTVEITETSFSFYERQIERLKEYDDKFQTKTKRKTGWEGWKNSEIIKLKSMYYNGVKYGDIAKEIGRTYPSVMMKIKRLRSEGDL